MSLTGITKRVENRMLTTEISKKKKLCFKLTKLVVVIVIILGVLFSITVHWHNTYRQNACDAQAKMDTQKFYLACLSDVDSTGDKTFDSTHLPPDYHAMPPAGGSFVFVASTISISCDAKFKHSEGSKTYTLDSGGRISVSP